MEFLPRFFFARPNAFLNRFDLKSLFKQRLKLTGPRIFFALSTMSYNVPRIHELPKGVVRSIYFLDLASADRGPTGPKREYGVIRCLSLPRVTCNYFTFFFVLPTLIHHHEVIFVYYLFRFLLHMA